MGRYACYRLFCLATLILLTSIDAVVVNINETTDYDGVHVVLLHKNLYWCYRHAPTDGRSVSCVLIDNVDGQIFVTSAPYLDVLSDGITQYFKVENSNWFSSTPFIGNKYNYYRVEDSEVFPCDGLEYVEVYFDCFRRNSTLNIWWSQDTIRRIRTAQGLVLIPRKGICIDRVGIDKDTLWKYEEYKGLLFVMAVNRTIHRRTVVFLYFKDLNDNEIEMNFLVWRKRASHISPWKGCPKKYDLPPEKLPKPCVSPRVESIPIVINLTRDMTDTPLLKVIKRVQEEGWMTVYIVHPNAHIKKVITPHITNDFTKKDTYLAKYQRNRGDHRLQVLLYEGDTTRLFETTSDGLQRGKTQVTDPRVIVHSFPLYTEAEVDERMYTKRDITIGGIESVVYTARPHLAFSQVYHDGKNVFVEGEPNALVEQFIVQDALIYIVVREANKANHLRFLRARCGGWWKRANDEHPDFIPR